MGEERGGERGAGRSRRRQRARGSDHSEDACRARPLAAVDPQGVEADADSFNTSVGPLGLASQRRLSERSATKKTKEMQSGGPPGMSSSCDEALCVAVTCRVMLFGLSSG